MPVESPVNYISDLVPTNPIGATDPKSQGDDHIRNIKLALKNTFPNLSAAVTSDATELNYLDGATGVTGTGNTVRSASPTFTGTVNVAALTASGVILGSDGSAAAPAFAFSADPDTGIYRIGLDQLGVSAAGVLRLTVDSSGTIYRAGDQARFGDGSAVAPPITFTSDLDTGIFRAGANNMRVSAGGVNVIGFTSTQIEPFLQIQATDGTAAAPAYSFSNDPDTGIFRSNVNEISVSTGGVRKLYVTGTNSVGAVSIFENGTTDLLANIRPAAGKNGWLQFTEDAVADRWIVGISSANARLIFATGNTVSNTVRLRLSGDQLEANDGTAAAPVYSFTSDPDTGLFLGAANICAVATGGARRVQFGSFGLRNDVDGSAGTPSFHWESDPDTGFYRSAADQISFAEGGTGFVVGYRDIPRRTSGFVRGQMLAVSAGVTLNTSDMAAGYAFSVYNDSAAAITLTQGAGVTLRLAGTTSTGNRTIPARGVATIWCNSGTEAVVSGAGVT